MISTFSSGPSKAVIVRSQWISTPSCSASVGLVLVGRHLRARAAVDDQRLLGAHAPGDARGVHGGVAAAVDGDAPADPRPLAELDAAQERDGVDDPARVARGDVDPLREVRADGDEDGVEATLGLLGERGP